MESLPRARSLCSCSPSSFPVLLPCLSEPFVISSCTELWTPHYRTEFGRHYPVRGFCNQWPPLRTTFHELDTSIWTCCQIQRWKCADQFTKKPAALSQQLQVKARVGFTLADCACCQSAWKEPNYKMQQENTLSSMQPLVLHPAGVCSALIHSRLHRAASPAPACCLPLEAHF